MIKTIQHESNAKKLIFAGIKKITCLKSKLLLFAYLNIKRKKIFQKKCSIKVALHLDHIEVKNYDGLEP